MTTILTAVSLWLHSLATVVLIGHYILLALVYLPVFSRHQSDPAAGAILSGISRQSRPWMYASMLVFILTGTYIMLINPSYLGVGDFGNLWAVMMLVKHILVVGMIGLGFWYNGILHVGPQLQFSAGKPGPIARFRQYTVLMAVAGALVLLLTSIAQAQ